MPLSFEIADADIYEFLKDNGNFSFDDIDRKEILQSLETIDVQACPGSGKTTLIAAKLILLAKKWPYKYQGVCVLSHTNVAKNEIIKKIKDSKCFKGQELLSYPHFIGTIQDFVDTYLALPLLRQRISDCKLIDSESFHNAAISINWPKVITNSDNVKKYLKSLVFKKQLHFGTFYYVYNYETKSLVINTDFVNSFYKKVKEDSFSIDKLIEKKRALSQRGFFLYRDMYSLSERLLHSNANLVNIIRKRFPLVFIDEMQDTQRFQDELLQKIFPLDFAEIIVQRFGDPDQAIFSNNEDAPNDSYNKKSQEQMFKVINTSYRFDNLIASKIRGLSFNGIVLQTALSLQKIEERNERSCKQGNFEHTIFIYNDETVANVVPQFIKHVAKQFVDAYQKEANFTVKIIGAVGKDIQKEGDHRITSYWPHFDNKKSSKFFNPNTFIEAVYYSLNNNKGDFKDNYQLLNGCVLDLLRKLEIKDSLGDRFYTSDTLKMHLESVGRWDNYRRLIYEILTSKGNFSKETWEEIISQLQKILEISSLNEISAEFVKFHNQNEKKEIHKLTSSVFETGDVKIEFSTIHGVKGETHDATLVLETKNYSYDITSMLSYLTGDAPSEIFKNCQLKNKPTRGKDVSKRANQMFMRQLYVAMSRSRHLLCFSIHGDMFTQEYKEKLEKIGWHIFIV